ncbi:hypothetical protein [Bradyrhizobium sp. AZCC 2289]|uniref:hypothetical protein n=1 Tax=Bradyrhizobium sp. AZCC 2289 TaxID=3117026 RepID=UPI002FF318F9
MLDHYPEQGVERLLDFGAPDTVDWLISLFVWVVAGRAPTAKAEIAFLSGNAAPDAAAADVNAAAMITQQRLKTFMQQLQRPGTENELAPADALRLPQRKSKAGRERFSAALKKAAAGAAPDGSSLSVDDYSAATAFASMTDVGVYLRWFNLFTLYRHTLAERLARAYDEQNFKPLLVAPSIVNYSRWLNEDVTSPLNDQVEVMGMVSKRSIGAMVHGYVGYDPLAQVYFRRGLRRETDQIALVKSAVEDHGFIGVKLYPPMGFKPLRNARSQTYPKPIIDELGVEPQQVVLGQAEAADGWFGL